MTGLELFKKELLFESSKIDKKLLKIFYKLDINIIKKDVEDSSGGTSNDIPPEQNNVNTQQPDMNAAPAPTPDLGATPAPVQDVNTAPAPTPDLGAAPLEPAAVPLPSVVTEDDDSEKVVVNDEDSIVRKLEGEIQLQKEEVDEIQTVEDLINKLTDAKKDGVEILDEFSSDIISTCLTPQLQAELAQKVDKRSLIFAEILYGKKRENSVGVRIIKRKNSDLLTVSMMIDNKIINSQYKKETLDKRITDIRNDEFDADVEN